MLPVNPRRGVALHPPTAPGCCWPVASVRWCSVFWPEVWVGALCTACGDAHDACARRRTTKCTCRSTGCGDVVCGLCQYNPSRLCTRNVKQKYLIDDHLKAKCSAPLRVELVDDSGACHSEGLPPGVQLEVRPPGLPAKRRRRSTAGWTSGCGACMPAWAPAGHGEGSDRWHLHGANCIASQPHSGPHCRHMQPRACNASAPACLNPPTHMHACMRCPPCRCTC